MVTEMQESQIVHRAGVRLAHDLGVKRAVATDYPGGRGGRSGSAPWLSW